MKKIFTHASRGDSDMIVVIVILVGAFLLVGGQFLLHGLGGFGIGPKGPGTPGDSGGSITPTPAAAATWSIEQINGKSSCDSTTHDSKTEIALHGPEAGFYKFEVKNGDTYEPVYIESEGSSNIFNAFTPNTQFLQLLDLNLKAQDGFNTKPWRVLLFQGGTLEGSTLKDGVQKVEKNFDATGC